MAKTFSAIRHTVRQFLKDEFKVAGTDFANDELDLHISKVLVKISQRLPYKVRETVVSDGSKEIDISSIDGLIGEKVVKAEYPMGSDQEFSIFGNTLSLSDTTPTSGEDIYLYCHKVHQLTESSSTLTPDLEEVLVDGVVAKAALAWCNRMRKDIVPASSRWYQNWAGNQYNIYQNSLRGITPLKVWKF